MTGKSTPAFRVLPGTYIKVGKEAYKDIEKDYPEATLKPKQSRRSKTKTEPEPVPESTPKNISDEVEVKMWNVGDYNTLLEDTINLE